MKALIAASLATAAIFASIGAFAQSDQAADGTQAQHVAQQPAPANEGQGQHHWYSAFHRKGERDSNSDNECVGPVSFCNLYFGS